jgi:uncharacterized DUF497 family protein
MKPWEAEGFEWDQENEAELAAHNIDPSEVEDLYWQRPVFARNKHAGSGDWKMIGRTEAGRALTIVVTLDERRRFLRPITGWDTTVGETTKYLRGTQ